MKRTIYLLLVAIAIISSYGLSAQVAVTTDGSSADASAMLEVKSTVKGFLPPRMSETQRDDITDPVAGLQIFNSTTNRPNYFDGFHWMHFDDTAAEPLALCDFYRGGVIFYLDGNGGGLVCAVSDQNGGSSIQWYNGTNLTTGATATAIGTGQANTTAIITNQGAGSYAATVCDNYTAGGYSVWFLPSKDELNEIFLHRAAINVTATANGGCNLTYYSYWSSTESDLDWACYQELGLGQQGIGTKYSLLRVRAVLAF